MEDRNLRCSRRKFLAQAAALTMAGGLTQTAGAKSDASPHTFRARPPKPSADGRKPHRGGLHRLPAAVARLSHRRPIYSRLRSRWGLPCAQGVHPPLYVDQVPENDLSREVGREFGIRVTRSVEEALTDGKGQLAVEGVLLIGEHGNYPRNDKGQILYPRYEMMERIVSVFRETGQTVPVFNDKHLLLQLGARQANGANGARS